MIETEALNPAATVPKYFHFATVICQHFRGYNVGAQLPPLTDLAEQFSVSKQTINRSMRYLAERGFVKSERGRGTVILKDLRLALGIPTGAQSMSTPDPSKQNASKGAARTIGLVLKNRGSSPSPAGNLTEIEIVSGLQKRLQSDNFTLSIVVIDSKTPNALEEALCGPNAPDGFVFMIGMLDKLEALRVAEIGKPVVVINEDEFSDRLTCVVAAEEEGMMRLMNHLFSLGHTKVAFLGLSSWEIESPRFRGYARAYAERGLPRDPDWVVSINGQNLSIRSYVKEETASILEKIPGCTALITAAPLPAEGFCDGLRTVGKIPGKDFSVACFGMLEDEWNSIADGHDKLTNVVKPRSEMGRCAAQILLDQVDRGYIQSGCIRLPAPLQIGSTTGPASADAGPVA